jgi:hypothetical protein
VGAKAEAAATVVERMANIIIVDFCCCFVDIDVNYEI